MVFRVLALCVGGIEGGEISVHHFASHRHLAAYQKDPATVTFMTFSKRGRPDNRMRSACVAKRLGDFGYALRHNET